MSDELVTLEDDDQILDVELENYNVPVQEDVIHSGTTAYWESQPSLVGEIGHIYAYTDYVNIDEEDVPAIKVGDGVTLLSDLPFVSGNNDILNAHITNTDIHVTAADKESWNNKLDPVEGKGLSTNDFTNELKAKLEGIEAGAEANVQADWSQTLTTADDFIKNKPSIPENTSDLVNDSGFITAALAPVQGVKGSAESAYRSGNVSISKADIGLGNVTNDAQVKRSEMGVAEGVATLDSNGKVPSAQLPSFVDDVLEYASDSAFPETGETGKIYVALDTNKTYRWGGSAYVEISESLALGETSSTAYAGNKGKANRDDLDAHIADNVRHITDAERTSWNNKVDKEAGKSLSSNDFTTAEKEKLAGIAAGAEVNVQANWNESDQTADSFIQNKPSIPSKTSDLTNDSGFVTDTAMQSALDQKVDKAAGKGLSTEDFTSAEKTKLAGIEAGAQVNTITGVKGDAETDYRTGNVNITKENIGLGNVDNTSDADKPISTAVQTALDGKQATLTFDNTPTAGSTNPVTSGGIAAEISALNSNLSRKVSSVNGETPDTNGNVEIDATDIETSSGVAIKSISGNPVTIADALQGKALGVNVTLEPIQSGSGDPSPTNIRPISGRTQVDVNRTGKNLLEDNVAVGAVPTTAGGTITRNSDYSYVINGAFTRAVVIVANMETGDMSFTTQNAGRKFLPNGIYRISLGIKDADSTTKRMIALQICQTNNASGNDGMVTATVREGEQITIDDSYAYNWVRLYIAGAYTFDNVTIRPMIYLASISDSLYEPYVTPQSVTVNLGQTVYGGTLNVTTGELTVETANIASYNGESIGEPWWSSMDEYVAGATPTTGAQVVYTLDTPIELTVTPVQLILLEGYNIITTNADDLSVRYYATGQTGNVEGNIAFLLDKTASNETAVNTVSESIAPAETGTATQNYAAGSYLMLNNRLCKVTSAIATGEQIIVGSNVQYTTVADELKAILAQLQA